MTIVVVLGTFAFANEPVPTAKTATMTPPVPHCEVPCGIYSDQMRFEQMLEDTATIAKSIDNIAQVTDCLLYTSPSPRDQRGSRMPSSA